jgi:lipopolysaccharide/colanic/teichoic acid biosynthesis glycosyltransferase
VTTRFAPGRASPRAAAGGRGRRPGLGTARAVPIALLVGSDAIAVTLAAVITAAGPARGVGYGLLVLAAMAVAGLYRPRIGARVSDQAGRLAVVAALPTLALLPWTPADTAIRAAASTAGLLIGLRAATAASQRAARKRGLLMQQTLIIGAGQAGCQVYRLLRVHPELGLRPCGVVDNQADGEACLPDGVLAADIALAASGARAVAAARRTVPSAAAVADGTVADGTVAAGGLPLLGDMAALSGVLARFDITQVLVCAPAATDAEVAGVLRACRERRIRVSVLPPLPGLGLAVPRACLDEIWGIPFVPLRAGAYVTGRRTATRLLDLSVGSMLFLAAAPVMLLLALGVWLDLRLPPLFRQVRVVGRGRLATIAKLRTLRPSGDPNTTWVVTARQSSPFGRLLRRTHADELPQLASVVRGDMALVGPRPERPHFACQLRGGVRDYAERELVRAGLTGWAQVHGLTGDTSIEDRARFDNFYIEYWSIWLDVLILARTGLAALSGALTKGGKR